MAATRKKSGNFEDRFFDLLESTIEAIDKKVDQNSNDIKDSLSEIKKKSDTIRRLSDRVKKLEEKVFEQSAPATSTKELPAWYRDQNIIKLATYIIGFLVLVATIYAGLKGIPVRPPGGP